ncbi:MAG: hemerythrin domain-containing protein [Planctomycetota bacterium]
MGDPLPQKAMPVSSVSGPKTDLSYWRAQDLAALIRHIVEYHHAFVRRELALIHEIVGACSELAIDSQDSFDALRRFIGEVSKDIFAHLSKEEKRFFPAILALEQGHVAEDMRKLLRELEAEHTQVGESLALKQLPLFQELLPLDRSLRLSELHRRLKRFMDDLAIHIALERDVLFPKAEAMWEAATFRMQPEDRPVLSSGSFQ